MKPTRRSSDIQQPRSLQVLLLGMVLGGIVLYASARGVNNLPEPSILSVMGAGLAAAIITWQLNNKT